MMILIVILWLFAFGISIGAFTEPDDDRQMMILLFILCFICAPLLAGAAIGRKIKC